MSVKSEITTKLATVLEQALGSTVGVIKAGPLQDSPPRLETAITLRNMDPFELSGNWTDLTYSQLSEQRRNGFIIRDEIGGARGWLLRGVIEITANYARRKLDRDDAYEDADDLRFAIQDAAHTASRNGDFSFSLVVGSTEWVVYELRVVEIREIESGGPKAWNWRYALYYEAPAMEAPSD